MSPGENLARSRRICARATLGPVAPGPTAPVLVESSISFAAGLRATGAAAGVFAGLAAPASPKARIEAVTASRQVRRIPNSGHFAGRSPSDYGFRRGAPGRTPSGGRISPKERPPPQVGPPTQASAPGAPGRTPRGGRISRKERWPPEVVPPRQASAWRPRRARTSRARSRRAAIVIPPRRSDAKRWARATGDDAMRGRALYVAELFPPGTADCSVQEAHFRRGELFGTDRMRGRCQYEVYDPENSVGIGVCGTAGSERTRSRCSDSPRAAAHSGGEASASAEPQPRVGQRISPLGR